MVGSPTCSTCGRTLPDARRWRSRGLVPGRDVRVCSRRCRRRLSDTDRALELAITELLEGRALGATCCPSEAARRVRPEDWRGWMEATRSAARRLCARGVLQILQRGRVVDPSTAKGAIRLRLDPRAPCGWQRS